MHHHDLTIERKQINQELLSKTYPQIKVLYMYSNVSFAITRNNRNMSAYSINRKHRNKIHVVAEQVIKYFKKS